MEIKIGNLGDTERREVGDGVCGVESSSPVNFGELVPVYFALQGFDSSLSIAAGTRTVWFEPS